ncbi:MAG: hypothetical protein Tsb0014_38210 [Pleurocapsa sp.]
MFLEMTNYPNFTNHNYQVIGELGRNREGGRISYLAETIDSKQKVVIKQFRFAQDNTSWQGFKTYEREIEILQNINHPRIPQYLASFETDDGFCMVQEYKNAPSLATKNSFTPQEIKQIIVSILEILVDLQQRIPPIIHRDIKPENILLDNNNQAYLIDFGLARIDSQDLAMSSVVAGTPGFTPPEELFHRPLTKASDLYSVGATAIALITNTPTSKLSNLIDDNYQLKFSHLLIGINPDFIDWLNRMVAPNLQQRFKSATEALGELKAIEIDGIGAFKRTNNIGLLRKIAIAVTICTGFLVLLLQPQTQTAKKAQPTNNEQKQTLSSEEKWFQNIKSRCNALEVAVAMKNSPSFPHTSKGVGYAASCYALAGKIDLADEVIQTLPQEYRVYAAEVVFNIGHPVADAGDDKSAGEIMELVLRYWSNNYMALYHAGMSAYILNDYPKAKTHLKRFLQIYQRQDYWTNKAKSALSRMEQNIPADSSFSVHH